MRVVAQTRVTKLTLCRALQPKGRLPALLAAITSLLFCIAGTATGAESMSEKDARALAISAPRPNYPYMAAVKRLSGMGIAVMVIDMESGRVRDAYMERSTGHAILDDTAVKAFRRWRFKPGTFSKVRVPISFAVPTRIYPRRWYPFQGVVRAVNANAGTMTVQGPTGTDPIVLTSDTGVVKNGKRGSLGDIAAGDTVRGKATVRPPHFRATAQWINITASARR